MTTHDEPVQAASHLFRQEVVAYRTSTLYGAIRLAQPISGWLVALTAVLIAISLLLFVTFDSITKKAHVTGILLPDGGSLTITAPTSGVVAHVHVTEGQTVTSGQVLFTLSTARQNTNGELTALIAQQLAARQLSLETEQRARARQYQDKTQALQLQLRNQEQESTQLAQEIALAEQRQSYGETSVQKFQALQHDGYVAQAQVQQKQEELLDISTRLSTLKRNRLQLEANRQAVAAELQNQRSQFETDAAQLVRALASLQQEAAENQARGALEMTAPQAGRITAINQPTGQTIQAGQILATLIPSSAHADELEADLYAPGRNSGFVARGQVVQLRYAAFPYQKFGLQQGTVTDISRTPFSPAELPPQWASTILSNAQQNLNGFNNNEALYRIRVRLHRQTILAYGEEQPLKPGMTLEADVLQEERKIWEWIAEPVLAMGKRTGAAQ